MKKIVCLFFLLFSAFAISAPESKAVQNLASCMIKNATQKEKFTILQGSVSDATPAIIKQAKASKIAITPEKEIVAAFIAVFGKCSGELVDVGGSESNASEEAIEIFMSSIFLELFYNPDVQAAFEKS
jgi:hypothetical protein